jgi:hypothetical protein
MKYCKPGKITGKRDFFQGIMEPTECTRGNDGLELRKGAIFPFVTSKIVLTEKWVLF